MIDVQKIEIMAIKTGVMPSTTPCTSNTRPRTLLAISPVDTEGRRKSRYCNGAVSFGCRSSQAYMHVNLL